MSFYILTVRILFESRNKFHSNVKLAMITQSSELAPIMSFFCGTKYFIAVFCYFLSTETTMSSGCILCICDGKKLAMFPQCHLNLNMRQGAQSKINFGLLQKKLPRRRELFRGIKITWQLYESHQARVNLCTNRITFNTNNYKFMP